jgi:hypothetical protein
MIYDNYDSIQTKIKLFLNSKECAELFNGSPRAVGDRVEEAVKNQIGSLIPDIKNFDQKFARRSMEDLAFEDVAGNYYAVDVKRRSTCQISHQFSASQSCIKTSRIIFAY